MDGMIILLNTIGKSFVAFSTSMLIQSSVLIIILLVLDVFLRKRIRAAFLYGIWMLILVKLVLPTTLSSPASLGYWLGDKVPGIVAEKASSIPAQITSILQETEPASTTIPYGMNITDLSAAGISPETLVGTSERFTLAASPATNSLSWQGIIFLGWMTIVIAMVLFLIRRMFFVTGLLAQSKNPNDLVTDIFEQCRKQMGVRRPISLGLSPLAISPSACGIFRPTILIPQHLPRKLKAGDLKSVLLHELAHIKRGDVWVSLIQTMLQIAYFYNPLLWVANAMIRKVREQAVDEMVLVALGEQAEDYPRTLLNISRMTFGRPALNLRLPGVVESRKALEGRIMIMLSRPIPKSSKLGYLGLTAIVVIGAILLPMGRNSVSEAAFTQENPHVHSKTNVIIPGMRVGDYTFNMNKDDLLKSLGKPNSIFIENKTYTLENLPSKYYMSFGDISFLIVDNAIKEITARSPYYKFTNGLGVGDSEQEIEQAFGNDFHLTEGSGKNYLSYENKGILFEISKKDKTVLEIGIRRTTSGRSDYNAPDQHEKSEHTIMPGLRIGDYTLDMRKDDVLKRLGEPETIQLGEDGINVVHRGQEKYDLNNLPSEYALSFGDISFYIKDDSLELISVRSPLYKLSNGLGVGDSQQKIKEAFGENFWPREEEGRNFFRYDAKGLGFAIDKKNQTVAEVFVYQPEGVHNARGQKENSQQIIVPGSGVGDYNLGMSKDEVTRKLGEPRNIYYGRERYTLDNLPRQYFMSFGDICFMIEDDTVTGIGVTSPLYKLTNGLGVGDSEEKIKQAFGSNFQLQENVGKDQLNYEDKGIQFEIRDKDRIVTGIDVYQPQGNRGNSEDRQGSNRALKSLPHYNPKSTENWQVDLRGRDVSRLDLRKSLNDLLYADFDSRTTWPTAERMPEGFDPERIMKLGKNPGLGVRKAHERGITGRGIGIAIVDQPLLTKHQEYADRLRLYEQINVEPGSDASMHGSAVASIAVGKTVGVAPEADLYYIGSWTGDWGKGKDGFEWNFAYYAQAVRRILEINKQLPDDHKIRVISMSVGWSSERKGYDEMTAAVEEAKKAGMFVVSSCIDDVYGLVFDGLSRAPLSDPDDFASYEPGLWLAEEFYEGLRKWNQLWVPMGSRTTAAPNGLDEYVFYRQGGWSWAIPYVAGVYALAAQVDPKITPERFWKLAMKTGRTVEVEHQGRKYQLGPIADPGALIDALEDN